MTIKAAGKAAMDNMIEVGVYDRAGELAGTRPMALTDVLDLSRLEAPEPKIAMLVPEGSRGWFIIETVLHGEKDALQALGDLGYEAWRPTMRKEVHRRHSQKVVVREFPLFNRYLFAEIPINPARWGGIRGIPEVAGVLGMDGVPSQVPEAKVRAFMDAEKELAFDQTRDARLKRKEIGRNSRETVAMRFHKGRQVTVLAGPFGGFGGQVESVTGRGTVQAMLNLFGGLTLVEFAAEALAPD